MGARYVLGIAGPPGAGKSTLATLLADKARERGVPAVVVPMDGFHLAQDALEARGLATVKGAPETFDGAGFVALLERIRHSVDTVWAPSFDRTIENPVAGSIAVEPATRLVIVEGNYLLDHEAPWSSIRGLLDESWYVDPAEDVRLARLVERHERFGRTHDEARARAYGSDERNARRVRQTRDAADVMIGE